MRGRIKLALTSGTLIAGAAIAYHVTSHPVAAPPAQSVPTASLTPSPNAPIVIATQLKHRFKNPIASLGIASFYSDLFDGKRTANGEIFNQNLMTACHRSLPFGTLVRVINIATGRSVIVRINDRGVMASRVIDLSHAAANELGMLGSGVAKVRLEILGKVRQAEAQPL